MSNDTSVNSELEGATNSAESQTAESETTTDTVSEATETSSEDVNTPEAEDTGDLGKQALSDVKAQKSINRVQELANRAKNAEAELQRLKQMQQYQYAQMAQQRSQGNVADPVLQEQILLQEQRLRRMEESQAFSEAERSFPELDRTSPQYNKDFDDLVYNTYRAEGISPKQAAGKVAKLLKIGQSKAASQLEANNLKKVAASSTSAQRSKQEYDEGYNEARNKLRKSGKLDDLVKILSRK